MRTALRVLLAGVLCGGCELATELMSHRRDVGIIALAGDGHPPGGVIAAPDTVTRGVPFDATITTIGVNGCWRADGSDLAYASRLAVVTPYDLVITRIDGEPAGCPNAMLQLPRTVRLVFDQAGPATLRVIGRKLTGGQPGSATPAMVEKPIVVR